MAKRIPLGDVCVRKIPTLSSQYDGLIDYVDISSVDNTEKRIVSMQCVSAKEAPSRAKQLLEVGDILASTVRPNLNAVAIVEQQTDNLLVGSTGYCILRCNDNVDKRYVFHFCQSPYFIDDMTSQATGASYPAVNSGIVKSSMIPYYPIEKQKLIADRLDKVSELISLRKEQLEKLDQLVKSRFIELFGDCQKQTNIKESGLTISDGNYSSKYPRSEEFVESGIPFIRANNLKNGTVVDEDMYFITPQKHAILLKGHLKPNDVLITTRGNIGQVAIVPNKHNDSNINAQIVLLRDDNNRFVPQYLLWALQTEEAKSQYIELQTRTAEKHCLSWPPAPAKPERSLLCAMCS